MKAVLVIIDGIICDYRQRQHFSGAPDFSQREVMMKDAPTPDSVRCLLELSQRYNLVYLTSRPETAKAATEEWLNAMNFPKGPLFVGPKQPDRLVLAAALREAEPVIRVARGSRGIVGSRDGEAAPYLFLVVEPLPPPPGGSRGVTPGGPDPGCAAPDVSARPSRCPVTEPKAIKTVNPVYPAEAKQAKLAGIVVLECLLDTAGRVKSAKAIRGEPMGLTEAALAAVTQWEFEAGEGRERQARRGVLHRDLTLRPAVARVGGGMSGEAGPA